MALASALCAGTAAHAANVQDTGDQATQSADNSTQTAKQKKSKVQATELTGVTVTGFRKSVETSIDVKRDADTIKEVVTAADIGGLPDVSISDALTRLPGVAAERIDGESSAINIRGLSGDFVETTLDGREQAATSGSRVTQFDQYPSELISQAAIYKSPKASLIEGGVAGTVEMQTANPLDNAKQYSGLLNVRGSYNDRANETEGANARGYRVSASFQGKFLHDTLGLAAGFASLYQPHVADQFNGLAYNGSKDVNGDGTNEYTSEGFELQQNGGMLRRNGYMAVLQWRPSDSFELKADGFYSKFDTSSSGRGFRVKTLSDGTFTNPVILPNGAVTGGTVSQNGDPYFVVQTTNDDNSLKNSVLSGGLNAKWMLGGWTISSDVSYSHAKSDFNNGVSWGLLYDDMSAANPVAANDEVVDYHLNGMQPGTVGFNHDYTDLSRMGLGKVGVYPYVYDDESKAFRTDVRYDFVDNGFLSALEMGVRYSRRTYNADRSAFEYGNDFGQYPAGQPPLALDPSNAHKVCFEGNLSSFPCFLSINTLAVLAANGVTPTPTKNWNANWTMIQSAEVDEHVSSGYVMADIDTNVANHSLTGNVGVRVVHTSQYSNGLQQIGSGQGEPITDELGVTSLDYIHVRRGKSYTDYLPSLNLNWHFDESNQLRFAAAKVMSRPPLNKLLTGSGSWIDGNTYNMWGNTSPFLDPFYAKQYDLSFEHYSPDSTGAFAAAVFFKHIDSFIEDYTINPYDFAGNGIQVPINPATGQPYENGQYQTAVNNDKGGFVRGIELSYSRVFNFLPGAWSGLGFTGSYSYSQSQVTSTSTLSGAPQTMGLPGLSPRVINGTLFYGNQGFDTRLSVRHRSAFVSNQMAIDTQIVYYAPETVVDYQASYAFKNGLSVLFQVNNLTDEPTRTYFGNEAQTGTLQWFGRQYLVGFTYAL
ncbi:TonB-dependent receptor [Frateuria sp. GZRR35]|uniref:TonB-dependent receptor n=2 Tax=unclassified Frateuria TaxID=2648894 RepID=UPI003F7313D5